MLSEDILAELTRFRNNTLIARGEKATADLEKQNEWAAKAKNGKAAVTLVDNQFVLDDVCMNKYVVV